jgi:hypothetical protein
MQPHQALLGTQALRAKTGPGELGLVSWAR